MKKTQAAQRRHGCRLPDSGPQKIVRPGVSNDSYRNGVGGADRSFHPIHLLLLRMQELTKAHVFVFVQAGL